MSGLLLTKTFSYNCKIYNYSDLNWKHYYKNKPVFIRFSTNKDFSSNNSLLFPHPITAWNRKRSGIKRFSFVNLIYSDNNFVLLPLQGTLSSSILIISADAVSYYNVWFNVTTRSVTRFSTLISVILIFVIKH